MIHLSYHLWFINTKTCFENSLAKRPAYCGSLTLVQRNDVVRECLWDNNSTTILPLFRSGQKYTPNPCTHSLPNSSSLYSLSHFHFFFRHYCPLRLKAYKVRLHSLLLRYFTPLHSTHSSSEFSLMGACPLFKAISLIPMGYGLRCIWL